jgi:hypothetical protein
MCTYINIQKRYFVSAVKLTLWSNEFDIMMLLLRQTHYNVFHCTKQREHLQYYNIAEKNSVLLLAKVMHKNLVFSKMKPMIRVWCFHIMYTLVRPRISELQRTRYRLESGIIVDTVYAENKLISSEKENFGHGCSSFINVGWLNPA